MIQKKTSPAKKRYSFEAYIIGFILAAATVVMTIEVIGRYLFAHSFTWSEELVRYSFVWFTLLGASYAVRENGHIVVDGVLQILPKRLARLIEVVGELIWMGFSAYIAYASFKYTLFMYNAGSVSTVTRIPMAFIYAAIPTGFALMSIRIVFLWIQRLRVCGASKEAE